jgi:hypothetical protein
VERVVMGNVFEKHDGRWIIMRYTMNKKNINEIKGWFNPNDPYGNHGKYHYFVDGHSLCGRWTTIQKDNQFEDDKHYHPQNCLNCVRKRDKKVGKAEL